MAEQVGAGCEQLGCTDMPRLVQRIWLGCLSGVLWSVACGGLREYSDPIAQDGGHEAGVDSGTESYGTNSAHGGGLTLTLDESRDAAPENSTRSDAQPDPSSANDAGTTATDAGATSQATNDDASPSTTEPSDFDAGGDASLAADGSASTDSGVATPDSADPTSTSTQTTSTATGTTDVSDDCQPTGEEQCFNQLDDDCNDLVDCEDPACSSGATCEPSGNTQGILVAIADECPEGYEEGSVELHRGLEAAACSGCTCASTPTSCTAELYFYADADTCATDVSPYLGGTLVDAVTEQCPSTPHMEGFTSGYRVGEITPVEGTGVCTPSGTATVGAPSWSESMKYCVTGSVGGGCQFGHSCVPRTQIGTACSEREGECGNDQVASTWYDDYADSRTCDACTCGGDGGCGDVQVRLGSDWVCEVDNPGTSAGEKRCDVTPYSPPAMLVGTATQPACEPIAATTGDLTPMGARTLCCNGSMQN